MRATWREAWERALYGPGGFYRRETPRRHFRTSPHVSPAFAAALLRLAREHGLTGVLDVGAGGGELLRALHAADPSLALAGVDIAARPEGLPDPIDWAAAPEDTRAGSLPDVLVVANEWLDNVPVDVAEVDEEGVARYVDVDPRAGAEALGDPVSGADAAWLATWWPVGSAVPGTRAEIGLTRDEAWAGLVRRVRRGLLVAVDYGHTRERRPADGTLAGYRHGRLVAAVPDGSCDVTAHVAMDSVRAAGEAAGARTERLVTQREALRSLGVLGRAPTVDLARTDPAAYARALAAAGTEAELIAPDGLGGFRWLEQSVALGAGS